MSVHVTSLWHTSANLKLLHLTCTWLRHDILAKIIIHLSARDKIFTGRSPMHGCIWSILSDGDISNNIIHIYIQPTYKAHIFILTEDSQNDRHKYWVYSHWVLHRAWRLLWLLARCYNTAFVMMHMINSQWYISITVQSQSSWSCICWQNKYQHRRASVQD